MRKPILFLICLLGLYPAFAQLTDQIRSDKIRTVRLHPYGNQLGYPVMALNSNDQLELHFDDLEGGVKIYYYTFQLCEADWQPVIMNRMDFIKGFSSVRINTYRNSTIAKVRYTHYSAILPDRNCAPSRSGNYILKVFLNGDTAQTVFTSRFLVFENRAGVVAQAQQTFNGQYFRTHQKVQFSVATNDLNISIPSQQLKVVILQNNRWDNCIRGIQPTFIRPKLLEYNTEADCLMPAGKEWRWLDLRSFRYQSDRILKADYNPKSTNIYVQPDPELAGQRYVFYRDLDGRYSVENQDNLNPYWQSDYATVRFSYFPAGNKPYGNKDVYVFGELTGYSKADSMKMVFNEERGCYEKSLFLKQGFYSYSYVTANTGDAAKNFSFDVTEGNYWEAQNQYMVLVYYRSLGGRSDDLVGIYQFSSLFNRPSVGF